ncbi:MAG: cbb3-type cytochrome c oxidase subunit 3 [Sphingomonadaceae bacterium]
MNDHSTYEALRHLADSWGLLVMMIVFVALCLWPFRPGAASHNDDAANLIFKDDDDG